MKITFFFLLFLLFYGTILSQTEKSSKEQILVLGVSHTQFNGSATGATARLILRPDSRFNISPELSYYFKNKEHSTLSGSVTLSYRFDVLRDRLFISPLVSFEGKVLFNDYDYMGYIVDYNSEIPSAIGTEMKHNSSTEFDFFPHIGLMGTYKIDRKWYIVSELKCSSMTFKNSSGKLFLTYMAGIGIRL